MAFLNNSFSKEKMMARIYFFHPKSSPEISRGGVRSEAGAGVHMQCRPDPDHEIGGGGGGRQSPKKFFFVLWAAVKGGPGLLPWIRQLLV